MLSCPSYYRPFASLVLHSCYGIESKAVAKRVLTQPARKNHEVLFFPSMIQEKKRSTFQISQKLNFYRNLLKSLRRTLRVQTLMYSPLHPVKKNFTFTSARLKFELSSANFTRSHFSLFSAQLDLILSSTELSSAIFTRILHFSLF